jgi:hypothetical protein
MKRVHVKYPPCPFLTLLLYLSPFSFFYLIGGKHVLQFNFDTPTRVCGFRVWNYNKNREDSLRGVKTVRISADNQFLGYSVFRPAPGCDGVEFGQTVFIGDVLHPSKNRMPGLASEIRENGEYNDSGNGSSSASRAIRYISPAIKQDFEAPIHPSGSLWKFIFYENWFDGYYVGLDAIEMFDAEGGLINIRECGAYVTATPHSLLDLLPPTPNNTHGEKPNSDPRTPEKLFQPFRDKEGNKRSDRSFSWLAPLSRSMSQLEKCSSSHRIKQKQINVINDKMKIMRKNNLIFAPPVFESLVIPVENVLYVMFPYPVAVSYIRYRH